MKQTVDFDDFVTAFRKMNRENNFSRAGLSALFEYLEEYEFDLGEEIELDVIALCCDFTEYESFEALQEDYSDIKSMDDLQDYTMVLEFDGGIIIQQS